MMTRSERGAAGPPGTGMRHAKLPVFPGRDPSTQSHPNLSLDDVHHHPESTPIPDNDFQVYAVPA